MRKLIVAIIASSGYAAASAQSPLTAASLPHSASAQADASPPRVSAAMLPVLSRVTDYESVGNFDRAIRTLSEFRASDAASGYDRYICDTRLSVDFRRSGNLPAAIRAEQSRLHSPFLVSETRSEAQAQLWRRQALLQIAQDELATGDFGAARRDAEAVLAVRLPDVTFPIGMSAEQDRSAGQAVQLAGEKNPSVPSSVPSLSRLAATTIEAEPTLAPKERVEICSAVVERANAGTLEAVKVTIGRTEPPPPGAVRPEEGRAGGTRLDLFADGTSLYVARPDSSSESGETGLAIVDARGARVPLLFSTDSDWDRVNDSAPNVDLIRLAGRYYVLGSAQGRSRYVAALASNHVEQIICEFTDTSPTETTGHIRLASPLEALIADAAYDGQHSSLIDYVLARPGTYAAGVLLEGVQSGAQPDTGLLGPVSLYNQHGQSILTLAVGAGRDDILRLLLERNVNADLADGPRIRSAMQPDAPLYVAVNRDDIPAARMLLEHGAKPNSPAERPWQTAMSAAFRQGSMQMLSLLLDHGGKPTTIQPDVTDFVQGRDTREMPAKINVLLRRGADADAWAHALFNAIARRSGLAPARTLLEREGGCLPEDARYVPVKTAWVDALLTNPTRVRDNGLEPLLREATTLRDASLRPDAVVESHGSCAHGAAVSAAVHTANSTSPVGQQPTNATVRPGNDAIPLSDRDTFIAYVAPRLQMELAAGFAVTPDPGMASMLIVDAQGAKVGHVSIQQQYEWCRGKSDQCEGYVTRWILAAQTTISQTIAPPKLNEIYVLVGPQAQFDAELAPRAAGAPAVLMRSCVAELVCVAVAERPYPAGRRYLDTRDLAALNRTEDQVLDIALANLRQRLHSTKDLPPPTADEPIRFVKDDEYESSRLLLTSDLASVAAQWHTDLVVAIPATDLFVYTSTADRASVEAIRQFALHSYAGSIRPITTALFRLHAGAWQPVP